MKKLKQLNFGCLFLVMLQLALSCNLSRAFSKRFKCKLVASGYSVIKITPHIQSVIQSHS